MTFRNDIAFFQGYYREDESEKLNFPNHGLTKREHFAAMAMQGILACPAPVSLGDWSIELVVEKSIAVANALIKELNKQP